MRYYLSFYLLQTDLWVQEMILREKFFNKVETKKQEEILNLMRRK